MITMGKKTIARVAQLIRQQWAVTAAAAVAALVLVMQIIMKLLVGGAQSHLLLKSKV